MAWSKNLRDEVLAEFAARAKLAPASASTWAAEPSVKRKLEKNAPLGGTRERSIEPKGTCECGHMAIRHSKGKCWAPRYGARAGLLCDCPGFRAKRPTR